MRFKPRSDLSSEEDVRGGAAAAAHTYHVVERRLGNVDRESHGLRKCQIGPEMSSAGVAMRNNADEAHFDELDVCLLNQILIVSEVELRNG